MLQPLLPVCCVSSMFTISAKSRTVVLLVRQRPEQRLEQRRLRASSSSPASSSCSRKSCVESIYHQTRTKTTDTGNKLNCLSLSSSSSSSSSTSCSSLLRSNDKYNNKALKKKRTTSTSPSSPSSSSFSSRNNRNKNVLIRAKVEPTSDQDDEDDGKNFAGAGFFHYISSQEHLHYFTNGLLDSRPAVYYLSLTVFVLFLTHQVIDLRRWKP